MSLSSGLWHFLLRKWFSVLCRQESLSSPTPRVNWTPQCLPEDRCLQTHLSPFLPLQGALCSPSPPNQGVPHEISLLRLSFAEDQLWELLSQRRAVCPREGKSHHFGKQSQFEKNSLSVYIPKHHPCFKG